MRRAASNVKGCAARAQFALPRGPALVQSLPMRPFRRVRTDSSRWLDRSARACAVAIAFALASGARAAETIDEEDRWVPSFGVNFDILGQKADGSVTTGPVLGPPLPGGCVNDPDPSTPLFCSERPNPDKILGDDEGSDTSVVPMVGGSLELMTPTLFDAPLRPRLFARGEFAYGFAFERNLAGQESPGEFSAPIQVRQTANDTEELSVKGQGSRTRMQVKPVVLSAGAGIAFSFDLFDRRIRLKPSVEYLHYELDLIGVVHRAVKLKHPAAVNAILPEDFRLISLTQFEQRSYDGIGPGLELEVDATRLGPFVSSIYIMGRGYHLFGDLDTTMSAMNEFGETASWTIEPDSWVWRSGVGFRLRWSPEE